MRDSRPLGRLSPCLLERIGIHPQMSQIGQIEKKDQKNLRASAQSADKHGFGIHPQMSQIGQIGENQGKIGKIGAICG